MKTARNVSSFTNDPFYFGKQYVKHIIGFSVLTIGALAFNPIFANLSYLWLLSLIPLFLGRMRYILAGSAALFAFVVYHYREEISYVHLIVAPVMAYLGCLSAVLIHNAAHANFRPLWINPIVGELLALHQLSAGFAIFRLVHTIHHAHPDDPVLDPHPPAGHTLWSFIDAARLKVGRSLATAYCRRWGESEANLRQWKRQNGLHMVVRFIKVFLIFCLLGPKNFGLFYLPSYLAHVMFFACFNFFTHRERADGSTEILNLDGKLIHRLANATLFGVMYHRNHHLKPKLFNPQRLDAPATSAMKMGSAAE